MTEPAPIVQRLTSRQFIVTLVSLALMYRATMASVDVGPLSTVCLAAIVGAAGLNIVECR